MRGLWKAWNQLLDYIVEGFVEIGSDFKKFGKYLFTEFFIELLFIFEIAQKNKYRISKFDWELIRQHRPDVYEIYYP